MDDNFAHPSNHEHDAPSSSGSDLRADASFVSYTNANGLRVVTDLPRDLPLLDDEIGLLRAFLSNEVQAILDGEK